MKQQPTSQNNTQENEGRDELQRASGALQGRRIVEGNRRMAQECPRAGQMVGFLRAVDTVDADAFSVLGVQP